MSAFSAHTFHWPPVGSLPAGGVLVGPRALGRAILPIGGGLAFCRDCPGIASRGSVSKASRASQKEHYVGIVEWLILIGVAMIDAKLWRVVLEQRRHSRDQEKILTEIRDRLPPREVKNPT
jgi:hypothetical protein